MRIAFDIVIKTRPDNVYNVDVLVACGIPPRASRLKRGRNLFLRTRERNRVNAAAVNCVGTACALNDIVLGDATETAAMEFEKIADFDPTCVIALNKETVRIVVAVKEVEEAAVIWRGHRRL